MAVKSKWGKQMPGNTHIYKTLKNQILTFLYTEIT